MADSQQAWLAILTAALTLQAEHAQVMGAVDTQLQDIKGILGPQGAGRSPLVGIGIRVTQGAAGSNATRDVLSILRESTSELDKAIQFIELGRKRVGASYAHGMRATLRIERALRDIGGI